MDSKTKLGVFGRFSRGLKNAFCPEKSSPEDVDRELIRLYAEQFNTPAGVTPARITEFRRALHGKTPEEALELNSKLIGAIWSSQCETLPQIRELQPDQALAAVAESPIFPGKEGYLPLGEYLQQTYSQLIDLGWKIEVSNIDSGAAQDLVVERLPAFLQADENAFDASTKYLPPSAHRYRVPTITITNADGESTQVLLTANSEYLATASMSSGAPDINATFKGVNTQLGRKLHIIASNFEELGQPDAVLSSVSNLIHEIDHSVQVLLYPDDQPPLTNRENIAQTIVNEGSSITAQRVLLLRLIRSLIDQSDSLLHPSILRSAHSLFTLLHSRSPDNRTVFYGAGKLLYDSLPLDDVITDGKMPQSIEHINTIYQQLKNNPEAMLSFMSRYFHDQWYRNVGSLFHAEIPLSMLANDTPPTLFTEWYI